MKQQISEFFAGIVKQMGLDNAVIAVTCPENPIHGDYTTNVAMLLAGRLKRPPMKIAQEIVDMITKDHKNSLMQSISRVEIAPPGFINMYMSEASLGSGLARVLKEKDRYGVTRYTNSWPELQGETGKKISSPETAKIPRHKKQYSDAKKGQKQKKIQHLAVEGAEKIVDVQGQHSGMMEKAVGTVRLNTTKKQDEIGKVMIEFADPNPFKEFHIGHLRNITLGESFARLMESQGKDVRRVNYQGDVGMHVAKALWGLESLKKQGMDTDGESLDVKQKASLLGKAYAAGAKAFEDDAEAKKEIVALNKKVYTLDSSITASWKKGRQWSLDYFDSVYARVGTTFERFYFESEVAPLGMKIVLDHVADGIFEASDGAVIYRGEKDGLHTRVFVTKEKYATYEAKDLALAPLKFSEWPYDLSIIMTGNEQSEYFKVMLAALKKIQPELAGKTRHIPFGMVNLKEGKMSSRTGNVITAEGLIDQAKEKIKHIVEKNASDYTQEEKESIAEEGAIGAVKYSMLKVGAASDIAFDLDASVSFDGDSGPYLQYTYARCKSVLKKAGIGDLGNVGTLGDLKFNDEERAIARLIMQFPDMVKASADNFAPNTLCTYLFGLAQQFNLLYAKHTIADNQIRLALTAATAQVLKNGLYLLGINVLERM